jgi:hypothetical protein
VGHPAQQLREPLQAAPVGGGGRGAQRQQRSEAEAGLAFGERAGQHGVGELDRRRLPTLQRREQLEQGPEFPTFHGRVDGELQHPLQRPGRIADRVPQRRTHLVRGTVGGGGLAGELSVPACPAGGGELRCGVHVASVRPAVTRPNARSLRPVDENGGVPRPPTRTIVRSSAAMEYGTLLARGGTGQPPRWSRETMT